jgi:DNA mismatch repair protein MutH
MRAHRLGEASLRRHWAELMDEQPLGEILEKALERQAEVRQVITPSAPTTQVTRADLPQRPSQLPSLFELAKNDDATAFIRAYRAKYKE